MASVTALFAYEGVARQLVVALKFRNQRGHVAWLGRALAAGIPPDADLVTWVPTTSVRRRERGVDQARSLALATARCSRLPVVATLHRRGPAQSGQGRAGRLAGPAYSLTRGAAFAVAHRRVAVVDDVLTTGASMAGAARQLREGGAASVSAHVVAFRRPP